MKKKLIPAAFFASCVCLSGFASAQETSASPEELSKVITRAEELLPLTPFRVKLTVEKAKTLEEGWTFYSYQETEEIKPGKYRNKQYTGNLTETIIVDKIIYSRRGEGQWSVKSANEPSISQATVKDVSKLELKVYKLTNETTAGKFITKFESNSKVDKMTVSTGSVDEWTSKINYWFDSEGRFLKIESISYVPPQKEFIRHVRVYEYDSNTKIEAPIK
jgi:hypothetical protein